MAKIGSINKRIMASASLIAVARDALHTEGLETLGRVNLNKGIAEVKDTFKDASFAKDIEAILRAELTFVNQELFNNTAPIVTKSLEAAKTGLTDALNSYNILVGTKSYPDAEQTHPTTPKYRYQNLPKDAFHIACNSHTARLNNTLKSTELSSKMRSLYEQRVKNMKTAKELYIELQRKILGINKKKDRDFER
ncbi:MAG: hypothetical protein LBP51_01980 [Deferribacteraceae bacterium]|jgi:hypothetical protein|nr:hypothetical protein [Deferribacteraceae bacterium]